MRVGSSQNLPANLTVELGAVIARKEQIIKLKAYTPQS